MVGAGYVGLVTAACFAEMGNVVRVLEADPGRLAVLSAGGVPIYEPGLEEYIARGLRSGRLSFTSRAAEAFAGSRAIFVCVGTPPDEDGAADLSHVLAVASQVADLVEHDCVVVNKSTVPVGTAARVSAVLTEGLRSRGLSLHVPVVSNPEFLKEGAALEDFMRPDRIVVGGDDERALALMRALYEPFQRDRDRLVMMDARSAELTKYAANAMLATRISFMNEMSRLAEALGADIERVRHGIGSDPRIGGHFLYAGCGYGGSCFPKDVQALIRMGQDAGLAMDLVSAVEAVNESQKRRLVGKLHARFDGHLAGRVIGVWGLAFKPGTDDMREAPSIQVVRGLVAAGAMVKAYDPVAKTTAAQVMPDIAGQQLQFCESAAEACDGADALAIVTEWKEFRSIDVAACAARMKQSIIFDGRNLYDPAAMRESRIEYHCVGRA